MKIYHGINNFRPLDYAVVTSGTFDGVHKGHQKILNRLIEAAREKGRESVLITFWPHPRMVLNRDPNVPKLINTMAEKQEILRFIGLDHLVVIPFTREFAKTTSEEFIQQILVKGLGTKKLIIGYNHRFGKNREGNFENLQKNAHKYGFEVEEIPKHELDHVSISSTKIRHALEEGDIRTANKYLGRPFSITGIVVPGDKLGRKIGYPTANIHIEEIHKIIPADGVYAVNIMVMDKTWKGMLNIGYRPTVDGKNKRIEVNIFDFDSEIYDEKITIHFIERIRDEITFESVEALSRQLDKDKARAEEILY